MSATSAAAACSSASSWCGTARARPPSTRRKKLHARIKARAFANGLLCYPMGGTIDGQHGDHVLLAPPFIVSEAELQTIVERLALSIDEALAE